MNTDLIIRLRELAGMTGAPTWIPGVIQEIEALQARVDDLEQQLAFYRRRVAA
jgi:hypothetical protein